jgi:hypothetical protein
MMEAMVWFCHGLRKREEEEEEEEEEEKKKSILKSGFFPLQAMKTALRQRSEQSNKYWLDNGDSPSIGTIPIHVKKQRQHSEDVHIFFKCSIKILLYQINFQ